MTFSKLELLVMAAILLLGVYRHIFLAIRCRALTRMLRLTTFWTRTTQICLKRWATLTNDESARRALLKAAELSETATKATIEKFISGCELPENPEEWLKDLENR